MFAQLSLAQKILFWVFIGLFAICAIFHLVVSFQEKARLRRISKPFLLLFLGAAIATIAPKQYLIYLGAFFGFLGDTLLIKKTKQFLLAGLVSFFLGHLCYIATLIVLFVQKGILPYWAYIMIGGAYIVGVILLYFPMRDVTNKNKVLGFGGGVYLTTLLTLLACSILGLALEVSDYLALALIGTVFFIGSDTLLVVTLFRHEVKRKDFYIMLTYLLAEMGLLFGLALSSF